MCPFFVFQLLTTFVHNILDNEFFECIIIYNDEL